MPVHFSEQYQDQLRTMFDEGLAARVMAPLQTAPLTQSPGETMEYLRFSAEGAHRPVFYVPGFTEGIVAKAPFAVALSELGVDIILPDQNRTTTLRNPATGKKDVTYTLAAAYLDVLSHEGLIKAGSIDVITHSYGSIVFEAMLRLAHDRRQDTFEESNAVMLAPAGLVKEQPPDLGKRWLKMIVAEGKTDKDFPDASGEMFKAGMKNFTANLPRTVREIHDLARHRIDLPTMLSNKLSSLTILGYAEDPLYNESLLERGLAHAEAGVAWAMPYSLQRLGDGRLRAGKDASHNDEQFNPRRVAGAVAQVLSVSGG